MSSNIDKDVLKELLKTNSDNRIVKRESNTIEFKENFDWKTKATRIKYIKSIAAFANRGGGYMFFGVKNNPRELVGLNSDFDEIDDADISSFFNTYLSPTVKYERDSIKIKGKTIGVIYIHQAKNKPIICLKDYDKDIQEGAIYYRYNSQSDKIKVGDLSSLLNEVREKESQKWIQLLKDISRVGIDNTRVFNLNEGEITSQTGAKFVLDEQLLSKLQVLDSYSSKEKDGAPAVRIIGEIDAAGTIITQSKYIHDTEIIKDFLKQTQIDSPEEYIKAICYQSSGILPVYYYIQLANISLDEAIKNLRKVNKHSQSKTKLLSRLQNDDRLISTKSNFSIRAETAIGNQREKFHDLIIKSKTISLPQNERQIKSLLEAILNLEKDTFEPAFVLNLLEEVFDNYYSNRNLASLVRLSASYIDLILFRK